MSGNFVYVLVIGGGVIGLAIAKNIAAKGREVIILEEEHTFGSITSTRNSGVIHAGVYYDRGSLKAQFAQMEIARCMNIVKNIMCLTLILESLL